MYTYRYIYIYIMYKVFCCCYSEDYSVCTYNCRQVQKANVSEFGQNGENELIIVNKLTLWNSHEYEDCAKPFQELGQVNRNLPGITSHFCVGTCISLPIN